MNSRRFSLKPFLSAGLLPGLEISGRLERNYNLLSISYELSGPADEIMFSSPDMPVRKNRLWEETCLELFIGVKGSECYWEFNLSPAGHWNVYSFSSYRQGMREEPAFSSLPFSVQLKGDSMLLSLDFELDRIMLPEQDLLQVGVSAVIKTLDNNTSYWALAHPGPQAHFHLREGFKIEM